jgi:hypothetical protein
MPLLTQAFRSLKQIFLIRLDAIDDTNAQVLHNQLDLELLRSLCGYSAENDGWKPPMIRFVPMDELKSRFL